MANNKEDKKWIITVILLLTLLAVMIGVPLYYAPKMRENAVKDSLRIDTLMQRPDWNKFEH